MTVLLSLTGLTRSFGSTTAVDALDLEVAAGSRHALIGPNGAGKTTVLDLVSGEVTPGSGRIGFDGGDVTRLSRPKRARLGIARTFQQPAAMESLTTLDNVALAAWRLSGIRMQWRRSAFSRLAGECLPHLAAVGLEGVAFRKAGSLAHGERRMLDIAMALASRPKLLLLDEPAAGLTEAGVERLLGVVRALPEDVTVVVVEHDFAFVSAVADTVTVLHDGRKLATGTPEQIAADSAVRTAYLGTATEVA
jgi:branched-chain amino acid transport system ATP-binding protein